MTPSHQVGDVAGVFSHMTFMHDANGRKKNPPFQTKGVRDWASDRCYPTAETVLRSNGPVTVTSRATATSESRPTFISAPSRAVAIFFGRRNCVRTVTLSAPVAHCHIFVAFFLLADVAFLFLCTERTLKRRCFLRVDRVRLTEEGREERSRLYCKPWISR